RVDVAATPTLTTITAYDSQGQQVGRLELFHGRFEMSESFVEGREDPWVTGRRLEVSALGQKLQWETEGFAPTLELPAHPAGQSALAAFLQDARVASVLEGHGIGFQSSSGKNEDDPLACDLTGTHPYECSGEATCATLLVRLNPEIAPPGTCARSVIAPYAWTVYQRAFAGYTLDHLATEEVKFDQSVVAQCCPEVVSGTTTTAATYAKKTCPESLACSPLAPCQTSCGPVTRPGACVGCPAYHDLTGGKCAMHVQRADWTDPLAPQGKKKVFEVCARFAWTCGDGYCDVDEDCSTCTSDCACHGDNLCVTALDASESARCCEDGVCEDD
ncbi:MAG TPA: hypothetical protein VJP40_09050, partial [bacterium]|nr:hypothetical protein [bacterium]